MNKFDPRAGAKYLIEEAIGATSGERIGIIAEDPSFGFYDSMVPVVVADVAKTLGITTEIIPVGDETGLKGMPQSVADALSHCDHVLFHSRLGDTLRFTDIPGSASKTMSYALDISVLGGPSCTVPHRVMEELRSAYNLRADSAEIWHITCANGTNISGTQDVAMVSRGEAQDFTVTRYPVCAPRPLACNTASGVVALTHWLMASGNHYYTDDELLLPDVVMAYVEAGQIMDFEGPGDIADKIRAQYQRVGDMFDIDRWTVHSWHAGINPGCSYPVQGSRDIERWGKVAFANPRYLHFHTCGDYAPGEIAWSIFDANVWFGDQQMWDCGDFVFLKEPEVVDLLKRNGIEELEILRNIGID